MGIKINFRTRGKTPLFQKALVGILFEDIITADMSKIEKVRVDRKIWILKRKNTSKEEQDFKFITE